MIVLQLVGIHWYTARTQIPESSQSSLKKACKSSLSLDVMQYSDRQEEVTNKKLRAGVSEAITSSAIGHLFNNGVIASIKKLKKHRASRKWLKKKPVAHKSIGFE